MSPIDYIGHWTTSFVSRTNSSCVDITQILIQSVLTEKSHALGAPSLITASSLGIPAVKLR